MVKAVAGGDVSGAPASERSAVALGVGAALATAGVIGGFVATNMEYVQPFVYVVPTVVAAAAVSSLSLSAAGNRQRVNGFYAVGVQAMVSSLVVFVEVPDIAYWAYLRAAGAALVALGCLVATTHLRRGTPQRAMSQR